MVGFTLGCAESLLCLIQTLKDVPSISNDARDTAQAVYFDTLGVQADIGVFFSDSGQKQAVSRLQVPTYPGSYVS